MTLFQMKLSLSKEIVIAVMVSSNSVCNRIYNKILDRDWFSARLFVA